MSKFWYVLQTQPRIVETIEAREDDTGAVRLALSSFTRGRAIKVIEGPLAHLDSEFKEVRDEKRVTQLVSLLDRKARKQISATAIAAA